MKSIYDKIAFVLEKAGRPLAAHEFSSVILNHGEIEDMTGRNYVGQSEASIARRLRAMRALGRVTANRRDGKRFVEYDLVRVHAEAAAA